MSRNWCIANIGVKFFIKFKILTFNLFLLAVLDVVGSLADDLWIAYPSKNPSTGAEYTGTHRRLCKFQPILRFRFAEFSWFVMLFILAIMVLLTPVITRINCLEDNQFEAVSSALTKPSNVFLIKIIYLFPNRMHATFLYDWSIFNSLESFLINFFVV